MPDDDERGATPARPLPDDARARERTLRIVLAVAVLGSFVTFLDGTIANIALPAISRELGGGLSAQQWVSNAYLITLGSVMLLAGSLSDEYGRIRILRIGLVGFGLSSVAIGVAPSIEFLIVARAVQGLFGALLVPSSLALITTVYPSDRRARAIGIWTAATSGAQIVGPVIGGLLVDLVSWRFAFLINVVPIAVTLVLLHRLGMRDERHDTGRIDLLGAALGAVGLGGVVFALIEGPVAGWGSPLVLSLGAVGVAALVGFLVRQATARHPLVPLGIFRNREFSAGNLTTLFVYAALSLVFFVLGLYLQQNAGLTATEAGLATLPTTIVMILASSRVGALAGRFGPRLFMTLGPLLMAAGTALLLTVSAEFSYVWQVLPGVVLLGVGLTLTVTPLTSTVLGGVSPTQAGIASAVNNSISRIAGLISVAAVGAVVGGVLDLVGFHRVVIVTAVLFAVGGVVSWIGIRNPESRPSTTGPAGTGRGGAGT